MYKGSNRHSRTAGVRVRGCIGLRSPVLVSGRLDKENTGATPGRKQMKTKRRTSTRDRGTEGQKFGRPKRLTVCLVVCSYTPSWTKYYYLLLPRSWASLLCVPRAIALPALPLKSALAAPPP